MKRTTPHIIEEESRMEFARIIPLGWVKNDFTKDYGKDIHVEIFHNKKSTGNFFIVQIKGNSRPIKNDVIKVQVKAETLKYYNTLEYPVLLVFYSTIKKHFWAIWANKLYQLLDIKENQKTVSLCLQKENQIDKTFFEKLETDFNPIVAHKINLIVSSEGQLADLFAKRFKGWCNLYFADSFEFNNSTIPYKLSVLIIEQQKEISIQLFENKKEYALQVIDKSADLSILFRPVLYENEISSSECELLYLVSSSFSELHPQKCLKLLCGILYQYNGPFKNQKSLTSVAEFAIENNYIYELQELIEKSITHNLKLDFEYLNSAFLRRKEFHHYFRKNLLKAIDAFPDKTVKARQCYNLGNQYRSSNDLYLAFTYYRKASKFNPDYLNRYYWWHELAGIVFLSSHFLFAEKFYRNSIDKDLKKDNIPFTYCLLADCLFHQTKFSEAISYIERYICEVLKMGKVYSGYYAFKNTLCKNLINLGYENTNLKNRESVVLYKKAINENDESLLYESIKLYPLMYYAWHRLGDIYRQRKDFDKAYDAYLTAAIIIETDHELWIDCMGAAIAKGSEELATGIFGVMYQMFGRGVLNDLAEIFSRELKLSPKDLEETMKSFIELAEVYENSLVKETYTPPPIVYRHL